METQAAAATPPPPPSSHTFAGQIKYKYDVYMSFRGVDARHMFTMPLYEALRRKGINAFIDKRLEKGKRIAPTLLKAMERSRISIIVFSQNYASSTWCLEELAHIIWIMKAKNQLVMPVFYKVDPLDVQYQRNSFEKAMAAHEDRFRGDPEKVQKWRSALFEAASLSQAWLFEDGYEFGFIERIVEDAYAMLPPKLFHIMDHIVGLEPHVEEVVSLLNQSEDKAYMLGIHGTGGIGKTTLAKAVYNSILHHFEGACFLFDVKEASKKYNGIVRLQQQLLSDILEEKTTTFWDVAEGISRIKRRLSHKKVLLVVDDVDEIEQLEQLAGGCDWFGDGSKIIITTRNKLLLIAHDVEKSYEVKELNEHQSLELFCRFAFHMKQQPPKKYQKLSSSVIRYARGHPLALKVIGSNLANRTLKEWRSILEQYEKIQDRTIHEVLKISYDSLEDGAKRIFLDIACFVDQQMLESLEDIIQTYDYGRYYLELLIDKSLIAFNDDGFLSMLNVTRQMGREIVRQEAPLNPEKRSRLWYYKDVLHVLRANLGCNNIEGIMLDPPEQKKVKWRGTAFEKMNNLRILVVWNVRFSIGPTHLPNSLRWLEWEGYPCKTLPKDFSPSKLVIFKLSESSFRLKAQFEIFTNHMTHMDFSYCEFITEVPNMSQLQSLRRLLLLWCNNLIKVHKSVGSLSKLVHLDVSGCTKLSSFPLEIKMPSLEWLNLSYCRSLEYFPRIVGKMDSLKHILMEYTSIKELPPSIGNLSSLESLDMYSCKSLKELPTSLFTLPKLSRLDFGGCHHRTRKSLIRLIQDIQPVITCHHQMKTLNLTNCGLLDEEFDIILTFFPNLQELYVSRNDFVSLPKCIKDCAQLQWLDVSDCKRLRDIPELPLKCAINAEYCSSLTPESLDRLHSKLG